MIISPEDFENGHFAKLRFNWVKYIPELEGISTNGLLVFTYLREWWKTNTKEKGEDAHFYKFLEPCDHRLYREGDSVTEQLPTISVKQFRNEFDKLGVRHKSKRQFKSCENPFLEENGQEKFFCSYRTQDNITYYAVNKKLMNQRMREAQEKFEAESFGNNEGESPNEQKVHSEWQKRTFGNDKGKTPNGQKGRSSISTNPPTNSSKNTRTLQNARASEEKISLKEQEAVNGSKDKVNSSKPRPKSHSRCQNQDLGKGKSSRKVDEKIIAFRRDLLEYATRSSAIRSPSGWVETILEEVKTYGDESLWFREWLAGEPLGSHKMNEWEIAPDTVDPAFLDYLKRELKQPNDSEAQAVERTNQVLRQPDRARQHWQTYQTKTSLHQKQEEEKAEKELAEMDQVYPEDAPVYFVKDLITGEMFDRDFNDPMGGRIFKAGILRAYSHADHQEKRDIMLMLTNNNTTKEWARKTLGD